MADSYRTLYQGQVPNVAGTLATVPVTKSWIIKCIKVINVTAGPVALTLYKNGITDEFMTDTVTIPANGSANWDGTDAMGAGEYIAGVAGALNAITMTVSGDEVS
jgi:hypothetical protein